MSDINPGVDGSSPGAFVVVGDYLYFTGYNGTSIGNEFAYLDEPTYGLPETNACEKPARAWTVVLSTLALITLAAGVGLRRRSGAAQR